MEASPRCPATELGPQERPMSGLGTLRDWFAGNGRYMDLTRAMGNDHPWIAVTVALDAAVAGACILIALHWWRAARSLPPTPARRTLANLRSLFLFCGLCGFAFIPLKMVWPAWRLYDLVLLALACYAWRCALHAGELKAVYAELDRAKQLSRELEASRE